MSTYILMKTGEGGGSSFANYQDLSLLKTPHQRKRIFNGIAAASGMQA